MLGVCTVGLTVRAHSFLLVVVVTRFRRLGERDAGQRRVIGDVEGHDAAIPLAGHRNVRDRGGLGVQRELPRQLLRRGRGRDGGSLDGQRVAAVGQLVAVFVEAVENRVVSLLAFNGQDRTRGVAEQGLLRALKGVGAHSFPCLVRVRVGQLRRIAQQARAREHLARRFLRSRARHDEVRGVDGAHGGRVLAVQRVKRAQGHVRRRVHKGRGAGVRGARRAVVPLAVEDIRGSPGAVEAHVGNREARLPVGAREGDGTVDECALGSVGVCVRGEGRLRGHRDGHARAGLGGHSHRVGRKSQIDTRSRPVLRVLREELALHDLGQGLPAERVGVSVIGEVGQLHLEGPTLASVAQVSLGARGIHGSHHGRVHGRGRGRQRVHLARADATRGVVGAVSLLEVEQRVGGSHEEVGDEGSLLGGRELLEGRVLIHTLAHKRRDARDLRGRHRRAGHRTVLAPQNRGHDVTAGRGKLGLKSQVRGDAPRREVGDRGVRGGKCEARVGVRDGDGVGTGGIDGLDQCVLLLFRDGHGRHRVRGFDGRHVGRVGVLGVAEDEGGRLRVQLREAADLGLVRHVRAGRAVRAAAVFQDDGRREIAGVFGHHLL